VTRWFGAAASCWPGWFSRYAPVRSQQHSKSAVGEDQLPSLVQLSRDPFSLGRLNPDQLNLGSMRSPRAGEARPVETIGAA
jgi:hypothetical protein